MPENDYRTKASIKEAVQPQRNSQGGWGDSLYLAVRANGENQVSAQARFMSIWVTKGQFGSARVWIMCCKSCDLVSYCWFIAFVCFRLSGGRKKILDPWWESGQSRKWAQELCWASLHFLKAASRITPGLECFGTGAHGQGQGFVREATRGKTE